MPTLRNLRVFQAAWLPVPNRVRLRQHPSMRFLGLQFWITVPPNCHSGLVIYFGKGPKSLSDFKKSHYRKVRDWVQSWSEASVQMCIWKESLRRHFAISYAEKNSSFLAAQLIHISCQHFSVHDLCGIRAPDGTNRILSLLSPWQVSLHNEQRKLFLSFLLQI